MKDDIKAMSSDDLLAQINCHDPYDVEFVRRFRALEARVAAADKLAEAGEHLRDEVALRQGLARYEAKQAYNAALAAYEATKEQSDG